MFNEVDEALKGLVRDEVSNGSEVEVAFDAPTREWSARRNAPTVNLYLYDIREDLRRRERGLYNDYDERGRVVSRRQAPRHFKVSYLITAWTQRPEDEHRLLSELLYCFLRNETLPKDRLRGRLAALGLPVSVSIALPPPDDRSFADVWSALGGELKPSLDLVVTAPVDAGRTFAAGAQVEASLGLDFGHLDDQRPRDTREPKRVEVKSGTGGPDGDSTDGDTTNGGSSDGDSSDGGTAAGGNPAKGGKPTIRVRRKRGPG